WITSYVEALKSTFEVKSYDCCILGEVDKSEFSEHDLHQHFVNGGIEIAVKKLLKLEPQEINILAFSIGGTIAWKAGLEGLKINHLFAVSSTRLRLETKKPNCPVKLYYGEKDSFRPNKEWLNKLNLSYKIWENKEHQMYKELAVGNKISREITQKILT
ncbi:alpha/beta hydrolase, partial [Xanthovirga aplysinae]|uniref:alpha/beta hydrolase n=1 Tax=Xanthovirga aplysinae TaxID=2529853 RepID=UPI001656F9B6